MTTYNELNTIAKVNLSLVQPKAMAYNSPESRWFAMYGIVTEDNNVTLIGNCFTAKDAETQFLSHCRDSKVVHVYTFFKAFA